MLLAKKKKKKEKEEENEEGKGTRTSLHNWQTYLDTEVQ